MIHVCFCFTDTTGRYSKFIGTTMLSLFENMNTPSQSICIHILHDNTLTPDNRDKFSYIAGRYNQLVQFYNVEELCAEGIQEINQLFPEVNKTRYTIGMFYRFFIPQVLPTEIQKAIYLDGDIIVNLDIKELWRIDLSDKFLASVADIECNYLAHERDSKSKFLITNGLVAHEDYFCSGVLMLNLDRFRAEKGIVKSGIEFLSSHPQMHYPDQDVLNYLFSKDYVKVDEKFDVFVTHERTSKRPIRSAIYHYVVGCLNLNMKDPFSRLWMKYFIKTPFFSEDTIGHLQEDMEQIYNDLKLFAVNATTIMVGKNRAFLIEPQKIGWLKKLFSAREDELFIPAENNEGTINMLLQEMKLAHGKTVFFIMTAKHMNKPFPFNRLTAEGFVEGVDFVKGWSYLSGRNGVHLDTRPFIKTL